MIPMKDTILASLIAIYVASYSDYQMSWQGENLVVRNEKIYVHVQIHIHYLLLYYEIRYVF